jgi:hypothetical protein
VFYVVKCKCSKFFNLNIKEIKMSNQSELISAIAHQFTYTDIDKLAEGFGLVFESLPADNLTQWSKENGQYSYTCQALTFNAIANGIDYAVKNQTKQIGKIGDDLMEHNRVNNGTEFWNVKAESLLERLAVCEHNLDALEQVFQKVKELYEQATGDAWKPYTPPSKTSKETATASEVATVLARLKLA